MKPAKTKCRRRGTALYLTVLSTALIVSLLGLTGLTIVRIERKTMTVSTDRRTARTNAASAVQLALRVIANDPNWRTTYTNGVETTKISLGPNAMGTLSWILEDSDGRLTDGDTELKLKGVGRAGGSVQVSSVHVAPETVSSAPALFKEDTTGGDFDYVDASKWWAQYVKPDLPADAIEWTVTSVEFTCGKSGSPNQTLLVKLYVPDAFNMPDTQVDALSISESTLLPAASWVPFEFAGQAALAPDKGVCVALECETSQAAAFLHYRTSGDTDPNSDLIRGSQAGGWTTYEPGGALMFRLHGTYKTASGLQAISGTWLHDSSP